MFIIINAGEEITNPNQLPLPSTTIFSFKSLGERISNNFINKNRAILLTPRGGLPFAVGNAAYEKINGQPQNPPKKKEEKLVAWIYAQEQPIIMVLPNEEANKMAQNYWVETTFKDVKWVPHFGPCQAIVIKNPYITVIPG